MKRCVIGITGLLLAPAAALADVGAPPPGYHSNFDTVIAAPDFQLGPDDGPSESFSFSVELTGPSTPIVGVTFSGWFDHMNTDAWASDMRLDITSPDGWMFSVGGFGAERAPNDWEFQGSVSAGAGLYSSTHWTTDDGFAVFPNTESAGGTWTFTFQNTFGTQNWHDWSGGEIVLHSVPTPGSIALLCVAGCAAAHRRRR